ncbi:anti-sigma factor family protein [Paractinoplanes lichenicola]|uniref:Zf-HC2 domain-containing protein n=1 Tax=Paractinoplanes lichenicola TaxID=2802976 RepID=A0ABS1VUS4_9ACTN|nr:zf-HC2 domain-containing protein [Actinoplanes lichenicola]MBL7258205.1 zf-HC2 domain-containing protein [Actinoplanes lichenicola]
MSTPESANNTANEHVDMAGYLLEMLSEDEKAQADTHLAGCAECRAERDSLRQWSDQLGEVPDAMLLDGPPDDADLLLQRTLRQVRRESSGRRYKRVATVTSIAAAVAAIAVVGGVLVGRGTAPSPEPLAQPTATLSVPAGALVGSGTDAATGARMEVAVTPAAGWVRVTATVGGIPAGQKCVLEVVGRDGSTAVAGSWLVSPAGETGGTTLNGSALIDPDQVRSVRIVNTTGTQFVSVDV